MGVYVCHRCDVATVTNTDGSAPFCTGCGGKTVRYAAPEKR